jgi:hypothetical protein
MNEDNAFLPHFIDEEIYIIDDASSTINTALKAEPKALVTKEEAVAEEIKATTIAPVTKVAPAIQEVQEPEQAYEAPAEEVKSPPIRLKYQGQHTKGVLIIVQGIESEEQAFLTKVLGAVKLSLDDCAFLQLSENNSPQHHQLIADFPCEVVINFGGEGLPFSQTINQYKITFIADKKVLKVDKLSAIMAEVPKKKMLWECLQQLFS